MTLILEYHRKIFHHRNRIDRCDICSAQSDLAAIHIIKTCCQIRHCTLTTAGPTSAVTCPGKLCSKGNIPKDRFSWFISKSYMFKCNVISIRLILFLLLLFPIILDSFQPIHLQIYCKQFAIFAIAPESGSYSLDAAIRKRIYENNVV